jgi:hypothetical protein
VRANNFGPVLPRILSFFDTCFGGICIKKKTIVSINHGGCSDSGGPSMGTLAVKETELVSGAFWAQKTSQPRNVCRGRPNVKIHSAVQYLRQPNPYLRQPANEPFTFLFMVKSKAHLLLRACGAGSAQRGGFKHTSYITVFAWQIQSR